MIQQSLQRYLPIYQFFNVMAFFRLSHMTQIQTCLLEVLPQPGFRKCVIFLLGQNSLVHLEKYA